MSIIKKLCTIICMRECVIMLMIRSIISFHSCSLGNFSTLSPLVSQTMIVNVMLFLSNSSNTSLATSCIPKINRVGNKLALCLTLHPCFVNFYSLPTFSMTSKLPCDFSTCLSHFLAYPSYSKLLRLLHVL